MKTAAAKTAMPKKKRRARIAIFAICGALFCGGFGLAMFLLDRYGKVDRAQNAGAIVVLGAKVQANGTPGPSLRARTTHAVELYRRGLAPKIIFTGGVGTNAPAESVSAARLARKLGVPESAILREEASTDTWENIGNAATLCKPRGVTRVIVVSDGYHLWRARRNFAAHGIEAFPSPCAREYSPVTFWMTAREVLSVTRDLLFLR